MQGPYQCAQNKVVCLDKNSPRTPCQTLDKSYVLKLNLEGDINMNIKKLQFNFKNLALAMSFSSIVNMSPLP